MEAKKSYKYKGFSGSAAQKPYKYNGLESLKPESIVNTMVSELEDSKTL